MNSNHRSMSLSTCGLNLKLHLPPSLQAEPLLSSPQALLKMDCQGLVARLVMDFVLLTTAVELAGRWREVAEKLAKVSRQQMDAYEAPHRDKNGVVDSEVWSKRLLRIKQWEEVKSDHRNQRVVCLRNNQTRSRA